MMPIAKLFLLPALLLAATLALPAHAQSDKAGRYYEDALKRYQSKDLTGSEIQLKNALQEDRRFLPALMLLGKVSLETGQFGAAEGSFEEALRLGASRSEVAPLLARALVAQGRHAQMLTHPSLVLEGLLPKGRGQLLLVRAAAYIDLGDERSAMATIETARQLNPRDAEAQLAEVPMRIRSGGFAAALAAVDRALALNPELPDAHYQRGAVLHAQGRLDEALKHYAAAIARAPDHLESLVGRAGIEVDRGNLDAALRDIQTLRKSHPDDPRADYLQSLIAERKGDRAGAQEAMRRVAELLGGVPLDSVRYRPQILMLGGLAFHALNEPQKALPFLDQLIKQQPRNPATKLLAQILYQQGQFESGVQLLENYLRLQPQDDQAVALLAQGNTAAGRPARSIQQLRQALQKRDSAELRGALGQALLQVGKLREAQAELEAGWRRRPDLNGLGVSLVTLYVQTQQPAPALKVARELVSRNPGQAGLLHVLATAQVAGADLKGARATLEQALKIDRNLVAPEISLARLDARENNLPAAQRRLQALHDRDPSQMDVMLELATLATLRKQPADTERWLERAVAQAGPRELRPNFALVDHQLRTGQAEKALETARALLAKRPEDGETLLFYARAQHAAGDFRGSWPFLVQAGRRLPQESARLNEVGELQLRAGDLPAASFTLGKALEVAPSDTRSRVLLATVEIQRGELGAAAKLVDQVLAAEPKAARSHLLAAELAVARKQPAAALTALRRAHELQPSTATAMRLILDQQSSNPAAAVQVAEAWLRRNPNDATVSRALAELQTQRGQTAAARAQYERLLARNPNDAQALNNLALLQLAQSDLTGARQTAERALKAAPGMPLVLDTLAWILHKQGESERALKLLRDAQLRAPDHAEIRYHLAAVLAKLGRKSEALTELQAALANPAGLESVKEAQALLPTLK